MDLKKEQDRFHKLKAEVEAIEAVSGPMREARDRHVQRAREVEDNMNAEIKKAEKGLHEKKQDMAFLARGLNGKTGVVGEETFDTVEA